MNAQWCSGLGSQLLSLHTGFEPFFALEIATEFFFLKNEETFTYMNICWAEISGDLEFLY